MCRYAHDAEVSRLHNLDSKANIFLAIIALQITALGLTYKDIASKSDPLSPFGDTIIFLTIALLISCFLSAVLIVWALMIRKYKSYPTSKTLFNKFKNKNEITLLLSLQNYFAKIEKVNYKNTSKKALILKFGSFAILLSFLFLTALWILALII